jgi:hypothetical protein
MNKYDPNNDRGRQQANEANDSNKSKESESKSSFRAADNYPKKSAQSGSAAWGQASKKHDSREGQNRYNPQQGQSHQNPHDAQRGQGNDAERPSYKK